MRTKMNVTKVRFRSFILPTIVVFVSLCQYPPNYGLMLMSLAEEPRYERDRSASPRPMKREDNYRSGRDRSASPNGRMNSR